jgi:hypothetical protein
MMKVARAVKRGATTCAINTGRIREVARRLFVNLSYDPAFVRLLGLPAGQDSAQAGDHAAAAFGPSTRVTPRQGQGPIVTVLSGRVQHGLRRSRA